MRVAMYWRNKQLRYRLARALPKRAPQTEMPRLLQSDAKPVQLPKPRLTRAS
ncbi:MAG: hypothetical protein OXE46_02525 [Chloroflexi bacterium]|nr:hypothetical protein [Chloroflexota bacterium]